MVSELKRLIDQVSRDKGIDRHVLIKALEDDHVGVDALRQFDVRGEKFLDEFGIRFQEFRADDDVRGDKFSTLPQFALVEKNLAVCLLRQARAPGFRHPRRVNFFFLEQRQNVGIGNRDDLRVAALFLEFETLLHQPRARSNVLRVAQLRRRDFLAAKIGKGNHVALGGRECELRGGITNVQHLSSSRQKM